MVDSRHVEQAASAGRRPVAVRDLRWILFALLLAASAAALIGLPRAEAGGWSTWLRLVPVMLLVLFIGGYATYRYTLVRAGHYSAGKALVRVGVMVLLIGVIACIALERAPAPPAGPGVDLAGPLESPDAAVRALAAEVVRTRPPAEALRHVRASSRCSTTSLRRCSARPTPPSARSSAGRGRGPRRRRPVAGALPREGAPPAPGSLRQPVLATHALLGPAQSACDRARPRARDLLQSRPGSDNETRYQDEKRTNHLEGARGSAGRPGRTGRPATPPGTNARPVSARPGRRWSSTSASEGSSTPASATWWPTSSSTWGATSRWSSWWPAGARIDPRVSVATVYRTMKLLAGCGLAFPRQFDGTQTRYEPAAGRPHHDHLICTGCGDHRGVRRGADRDAPVAGRAATTASRSRPTSSSSTAAVAVVPAGPGSGSAAMTPPPPSSAQALEAKQLVAPARTVILVGNPNVGKSVLFGALTGRYVTVSNYPGTTVEVTRGSATIDGAPWHVMDTPGTNNLLPMSEDEQVTRDILQAETGYVCLQVCDAKNLGAGCCSPRSWPRPGCRSCWRSTWPTRPSVVASRSTRPAWPRCWASTWWRRWRCSARGWPRCRRASARPGSPRFLPRYDDADRGGAGRGRAAHAEGRAGGTRARPHGAGGRRLAARRSWRRGSTPAALARVDEVRRGWPPATRSRSASWWPGSGCWPSTRSTTRWSPAAPARPAATSRAGSAPGRPTRSTGSRMLLLVLFAAWLFVGLFGAGTAVDFLEHTVFQRYLVPWTEAALQARAPGRRRCGSSSSVRPACPTSEHGGFIVGRYGMVSMGLSYAVAIVLPIVATFFVAFSILEDSGYLPRLAVMVNQIFKRMGLNGKAVLPMVLGLGCDTMATMTARIMETRKERVIVTLLLALAVPCSAQLAVILAMTAGLPAAALLWFGGTLLLVIFLIGWLAAKVIPGRGSDFMLELPPLRLPQLGNVAVKTLARIEWYLREAMPLFLLGTLILCGWTASTCWRRWSAPPSRSCPGCSGSPRRRPAPSSSASCGATTPPPASSPTTSPTSRPAP